MFSRLSLIDQSPNIYIFYVNSLNVLTLTLCLLILKESAE